MHRCEWLSVAVAAVLLFTSINSAKAESQTETECSMISGMYVSLRDNNNVTLGNREWETELLGFAQQHGFNYLIFYDIENIANQPARAAHLAGLIERAKNEFNIIQIGAALGSKRAARNILKFNQQYRHLARIDVLNLEFEFWNLRSEQGAFEQAIDLLNNFREVAQQQQLLTEVYIGWISAEQGKALAGAVDRILVHYYRHNSDNILSYGQERLRYLASAEQQVNIAPIFSNEGPDNTADPGGYFMGPWLNENALGDAFEQWQREFQAINAPWKHQLSVFGSVWFLYNHFADITDLRGNANSGTHSQKCLSNMQSPQNTP
ncbi:hypothetical protein [Neptunicella marina]|uniref:GH18 domain-containing protein n=1 Tax=Neptunicella marina TaxID=2125989 RepID=A0A8J6IXY1_9ALTE|nr:hypothetical protein [Neptunicella marina]MBC3767447.1 hypothetical protein [Neptunicella marina]